MPGSTLWRRVRELAVLLPVVLCRARERGSADGMPNLDGRRRSRCFANPDFSNRRRNSGLETITVGDSKGVNAVRKAMEAAPCPIAISDDADEILGRPAFPFIKQPVDLDLVVLSVFELGFGAQAARTDVALGASAEVSLRDIYARAVSLGFELSPAEVGPVLRLQYLDQPHGEISRDRNEPRREIHR